MSIEELRKRRALLRENTNITFENMQSIANESERVATVAHNSIETIESIERDFEQQTGFNQLDVKFLLFATALQIGRWILINEINKFISDKINNSRI